VIDYDQPEDDPIVADVRRAREAIAARYEYDLRAAMVDAMRHQPTSGRSYASPERPALVDPKRKVG
jgi:hypothetical protein